MEKISLNSKGHIVLVFNPKSKQLEPVTNKDNKIKLYKKSSTAKGLATKKKKERLASRIENLNILLNS